MFDFTKEIKLEPKAYLFYRKLQLALYLLAFFLAAYLAYLIIFPHQYFSFSFVNPSSLANFIPKPRLPDGTLPDHGRIEAKNNLLFSIALQGAYSKANVNFILSKKAEKPAHPPEISVRKSYQAFMYSEGDPIGFSNSSLLKNKNDYYIVSNEQLRKFDSLETLISLGYLQENFQEISENDLGYNSNGQNISKNSGYPNMTLFQINNDYYILENKMLKKFVSDQAFLTSYKDSQAIKKDELFLNNFPLSENLAGFYDGALLSSPASVFVTNKNEIFPIDEVKTFESKGYAWKDVTSAGEDEFSAYQKGELLTIDSPHPDGTVFKTIENSSFYLIKEKQKHLLPTIAIANSWLRNSPILISEKSLAIKTTCNFKKNTFKSNSYSCEIPLDELSGSSGLDYEFNLISDSDLKIDSISVDYKKNITFKNFKEFFSGIRNAIKQNYVPTPSG